MIKALTKKLLIVLLLTLAVGQLASADVRNYRYDGNMPFIKMMLSMMSAMGMIDRVPSDGLNGGYYPQSRWGGQNGRYGNSPFQRSPWMSSPWMNAPGLDHYGSAWNDDRWGEPRWGILPVDSYSPYNNSAYGYPRDVSPWSSSELSGWVDEPWETSSWNPEAQKRSQQAQPLANQPQQQVTQAPVANPGYREGQPMRNTPAGSQQVGQAQYDSQNNRQNERRNEPQAYSRSPLSKLSPPQQYRTEQYPAQQYPEQSRRQYETRANNQSPPAHRPASKPPRNSVKQKPCVTEYCGLKKPNINGFWVTQDGEMLGIKNNEFLWSDGEKRRLSGRMKIDNEYLIFNVEGSKSLMHFKYKISGNRLLTMQPDGKIREFARMSRDGYFY
jgi:hypothetical protein